MPLPRLDTHVVLVTASVARYATTTNLLGVDFFHVAPPDTEFPCRVAKFDVFTRFFPRDCPPETLAVEVWRLHEDGTDRDRVHVALHEVPFRPGEVVHDHSFRLVNVILPSEGQYAVKVCRLVRTRVKGLHWRPLRVDYFRMDKRRVAE